MPINPVPWLRRHLRRDVAGSVLIQAATAALGALAAAMLLHQIGFTGATIWLYIIGSTGVAGLIMYPPSVFRRAAWGGPTWWLRTILSAVLGDGAFLALGMAVYLGLSYSARLGIIVGLLASGAAALALATWVEPEDADTERVWVEPIGATPGDALGPYDGTDAAADAMADAGLTEATHMLVTRRGGRHESPGV